MNKVKQNTILYCWSWLNPSWLGAYKESPADQWLSLDTHGGERADVNWIYNEAKGIT